VSSVELCWSYRRQGILEKPIRLHWGRVGCREYDISFGYTAMKGNCILSSNVQYVPSRHGRYRKKHLAIGAVSLVCVLKLVIAFIPST
jgi:hypothetical protein